MPRRSKFNLPLPDPPNGITITKLDAAKRQLDIAAYLWFEDRDPVSIHTLVAATMGILEPIARSRGAWRGVLDTSLVRPGLEEAYLQLMKQAPNFFKHASRDAEESIKFNPDVNELEIFAALQVYRQLEPIATPRLNVFLLRFWLLHRQYFNDDIPVVLSVAEQLELSSLSKLEFFKVMMPLQPLAR